MSDETEKWQKISGLLLSQPSELSHITDRSITAWPSVYSFWDLIQHEPVNRYKSFEVTYHPIFKIQDFPWGYRWTLGPIFENQITHNHLDRPLTSAKYVSGGGSGSGGECVELQIILYLFSGLKITENKM